MVHWGSVVVVVVVVVAAAGAGGRGQRGDQLAYSQPQKTVKRQSNCRTVILTTWTGGGIDRISSTDRHPNK